MKAAQQLQDFLQSPTRYLFFTGKGGVGKTTLACTTAVALADQGANVLLVSTDPASNLDETLGLELCREPKPVPSCPNLHAANIDPDQAAAAYRETILGPIRGVLPDATLNNIEEQLSGACTNEIASFNEFVALLGNPETVSNYQYIVLDTAPTGHTLRLLSLPAAWENFISTNKTGSTCLGPLSGLSQQRETYQRALEALADPEIASVALVARADTPTLQEAARASSELAALGIKGQSLILNAVFQAESSSDMLAIALSQKTKQALSNIPEPLLGLPRFQCPFVPTALTGIDKLRAMVASEPHQATEPGSASTQQSRQQHPTLEALIDGFAGAGHGVILTMGKGGVGKTSLACKIAFELAKRGHRTHLTTTDPANHLPASEAAKELPLLSIDAIDPKAETEEHIQRTLNEQREKLDAAGFELLEEELRSPCTEEIAVFSAFAREVAKGEERFVVLDTAPTGHTLLLLDATEAYHRQVLKNADALPESVKQLLPRLRDPEFCRTLIVTLPEATPVHEAAQLQSDLRRAQIEPYAWVINQCISSLDTSDPSLIAKGQSETAYIQEVTQLHASRYAIESWTSEIESWLSPSPASLV